MGSLRSWSTFLCLVLLPGVLPSQEWTRFRGPNGSGLSNATTIPTKWTDKDYNWKIDLPGEGASSPVIWNKHVYVTSADVNVNQRYLLCIHGETGKEIWRKSFPLTMHKKQRNNTYASSTPVVDADHVYSLWQSPKSSPLIAIDHQGNKVWEIDLGPYLHGQGAGTSPIAFENLVIVANDHKEGSFLIAVDRKTGKTIWKIPREGKRACYAAPGIFESEGRDPEIIFSHSFEGVIGVDPKTGKTNWHIDPFGRFSQRAIACPVFYKDLVIATSGFTTGKKNLVAIRPKKTASGAEAEEVYRLTDSLPHIPSPLVVGERLFLWSDTGIVTCRDVASGKEIWKSRVEGRYFGSPIQVNAKLYCVSHAGDVVVINAADKFELLARISLGDKSQATPAVSGGVMFLRTASRLYALGGKKIEKP